MWGGQSWLQSSFQAASKFLEKLCISKHFNQEMTHHERRLPHWDLVGQPLFVTFRLHGTLPAGRVFPPALLTTGKRFVTMDRILDQGDIVPRYLGMAEIAGLMVSCIRDGEQSSIDMNCIPSWSCRIMFTCW
jgi:hypothetical protein